MVKITISGGTVEERAQITAFVAYDLAIRGVSGDGTGNSENIHPLESEWYKRLEADNGFAEVGCQGVPQVDVNIETEYEGLDK